ncbi:MAG: S-methyl-5'-thioadenosine phosphorylase [Anaerolineae bacterium]|nr:S-methyl-5'-thioadenosine phosphorylase [Anaerolineae bacterium]
MLEKVEVGVIGGSGLYNMPEITDKTTVKVETPYGPPSSDIVIGTLSGKRVAFVPRHGPGHIYSPSVVPYRANIYALKKLGVKFIIAANACGSLREDYAPGHIVIPDQIFDNTKSERGGRTFFEQDLVAHVSVADPFTPELCDLLAEAVAESGGTVHQGGTFIIIEGPRFSTRGESHIFRQWGCSLIGMTTAPEAFLAREAEIAYATLAHITDYDVWHTSEEPVTAEIVIATMQHNLKIVQKAIAYAVGKLDTSQRYSCHTVLDEAIMVPSQQIPASIQEKLQPILERFSTSS